MASHTKLDKMRGMLVQRLDRQKATLEAMRGSLESNDKAFVEGTAKRLAEVERERDAAHKESEQFKVCFFRLQIGSVSCEG
jgi:hypothetical protein